MGSWRQGLTLLLFSIRCLLSGVQVKPTLLSAYPWDCPPPNRFSAPELGGPWTQLTGGQRPAMSLRGHSQWRSWGDGAFRPAAFLRSEVEDPWCHRSQRFHFWEGSTGKERATLHMQRIVKSVISKQRLNSPIRPMVFPRSFDLAPWVQMYLLSGKRHTDLGAAALGKQTTAFVSHWLPFRGQVHL